MAACSEVEEKASFSKDSVSSKIFLGETGSRSELPNKLSDKTKEELNNMSENAFQDLLEDIVSFNKPMNLGHAVIKDMLLKEVSETHEKTNVGKHSDYKHNKILLCDSTNSSNHQTLEDKKKSNRNREDSKSALNSDKNIQQSLSLQDLLTPDSKTKKSHKAQRTLSLSSEEASNVLSDSLNVNLKTSKKSNKQSNNSKNQPNRSNLNKSSSKTDISGFTSANAESGQKRKYESLLQNSTLPYETLINECDIPLPEGPMPEIKDSKGVSSSPVEFEMDEIKSDKVSSKDNKNTVKTIEKSKNSLQQSSSKFYLDSNDVDGTANCSIQFNSYSTALDDQNGGQVNFPIHWAKPMHTFISTLEGGEDYNSRNEKQLLNADINGNPFSRSPRSSLASIVSSTFLDYSNSTLVSESKNRKNKRLRNAVNKGVLSENIAGHRGEEDIDTLLQYINSSDKKGKPIKGNSQNHLLNSKCMLHENDKKKGFGKDLKNCSKNMNSGVKKKLSRSNSLENLSSSKNVSSERGNDLSYESNAMLDKPLKNSKTAALENSNKKKLDINSNVENRFSATDEKNKSSSSTDESNDPVSNGEQNSSDVSSFAADFYAIADVPSQTVTTEEAGFLIVKKKQRKKYQSKRSDSYRWRTAQNQRKKGMMLPLAESKCGKQDSRRKSTSSVPHSEHSSADNSDLDSVHSLPVRGSVPHPTQPHPHTTPSSSSSTPQASYADIARMPIPKLNSPSPCIMTYSVQTSVVKQQTGDSECKKPPDSTPSNFPFVKRKVGDVRDCTPTVNKITVRSLTVDDDASDVTLRSLAKSTRESNTQTEPESTHSENICTEFETPKLKKVEECPKSLCIVCSCPPKKNCSCSNKLQTHFRHRVKSTDIPPVIMDNMPAETNACNVSFGFGVEEVLQMTPTERSEAKVEIETPSSQNKDSQIAPEKSKNSVVNTSSDINSCKPSTGVLSKPATQNSDLLSETSSQLQTVCYGTGRNICYSETKVNTKKFNLSEITNYLGKEFQCIESELGVSKGNGMSSKIMYYIDSAEEA